MTPLEQLGSTLLTPVDGLRWFQSQFEVRLPLINTPLAAILPVLIFGLVLLNLIRLISVRSDSTQLKGIILVSMSLLIGYLTLLIIDDAIAANAYWLSFGVGVIGLLYVVAGAQRNPGRDTMLLFVSGLLLIIFSAYAYLSIWLASVLDQARCQPVPGIVTCIPRDFTYLLLLTSLWILPGLILTGNALFFVRKVRREKVEPLEVRGDNPASEESRSIAFLPIGESKPIQN